MRRAQLLVYEADGRLAEQLRETSARHGWCLCELRQPGSVLDALQPGAAGVLVLEVGQDLDAAMGLLEEVGWRYPDTATVVVGDQENPALADLAWDLGARFVMFPPLPRIQLAEVVTGLLNQGTGEPHSS